MTVDWKVWTKNFNRQYLSNPEQVVWVTGSRANCKLCEKQINIAHKTEHVAEHMTELDKWEEKYKTVVKEEKLAANPYYDVPCAKCGEKIPRTGKRGKPPKHCINCKGE